jgi:hypoxanthine phosphoribosyltransferase
MSLHSPVSPLVSAEQLKTRVAEIAREINQDYAGREIVLLCMLGGGWMLFTDLIRQLDVQARPTFLSTAPYPFSDTEIRILLDVSTGLKDTHIVIVDGAIISGSVLLYLTGWLKARQAASVRTCAAAVKPHLFKPGVRVDYAGFRFKDEHIVGYGIGEKELYAQLPFLADARTIR